MATFGSAMVWSPYVWTSTDGRSWTKHAVKGPLRSVLALEDKFLGIRYDEAGSGNVMSSTDGINWSVACWDSLAYPTSIVEGNGRIVIVSEYGGRSMCSTDGGVTWTKGPSFTSSHVYAVTYGGGVFYCAGAYNAATSTDGLNWSPISPLTGTSDWFEHRVGQ